MFNNFNKIMSKKGKATIHDIAKKLNVTASTVSRALKNNPRISDATKKNVQKAAVELNYQPNNIAAALRNGRSEIIGVIVPTVDRNIFASVIKGIERIANDLNFKVIICQSSDSYEKEVKTVEALLSARVDGIFASIGKKTEDLSHFKKVTQRGIPLVLFDNVSDELDVNQVMIDDYQGAYMVVEHLIKQGCRRIAYLTKPKKISIYKNRLRGYMEALEHYNIPFDENIVIESDLQLEDGRASMEKLLKLSEIPDAVFSASDYGAMGAMQVLKEVNIKIPQQVALAGFSNEPFAPFTDPSITSVDQLSFSMGKIAAKVFFDQIQSKSISAPRKTVLMPELIIRQSSLKGAGIEQFDLDEAGKYFKRTIREDSKKLTIG